MKVKMSQFHVSMLASVLALLLLLVMLWRFGGPVYQFSLPSAMTVEGRHVAPREIRFPNLSLLETAASLNSVPTLRTGDVVRIDLNSSMVGHLVDGRIRVIVEGEENVMQGFIFQVEPPDGSLAGAHFFEVISCENLMGGSCAEITRRNSVNSPHDVFVFFQHYKVKLVHS